jgi:fibronectin type 3 domain-containing protein
MKYGLCLILLLLFSCKNALTSKSSSEIDSNYHPGMSQDEISLPGTFEIHSVGVSDQEVTVSWDSSTNVSNYILKYGTTSGSYVNTVGTNVTSPVTINSLTNGVNYYFRVYAVNVNGTRTSTSELTTMPMLPPNDPTTLSVSSTSSHTINLAWTNEGGTGPITYKIYRSLSSGTGYSLIASNISALSYSDTALPSGQTYYYLITAVNEGGSSQYSNEVSDIAP